MIAPEALLAELMVNNNDASVFSDKILLILEAIAGLLVFLTGMVISFGMGFMYILKEKSKQDLKWYIRMLWIFIAFGALVCFRACWAYVSYPPLYYLQ